MPGFNLAGLWSGTDKNGEFKLSGKSPDVGILIPPGARIQILPNQNRFARLWDSINASRPGCSWGDNPWVWVVEFRRVEGEVS